METQIITLEIQDAQKLLNTAYSILNTLVEYREYLKVNDVPYTEIYIHSDILSMLKTHLALLDLCGVDRSDFNWIFNL